MTAKLLGKVDISPFVPQEKLLGGLDPPVSLPHTPMANWKSE